MFSIEQAGIYEMNYTVTSSTTAGLPQTIKFELEDVSTESTILGAGQLEVTLQRSSENRFIELLGNPVG